MNVLGNIYRVINADEVTLIHLPVNSKCNQCQKDIDDKFLFVRTNIYLIAVHHYLFPSVFTRDHLTSFFIDKKDNNY